MGLHSQQTELRKINGYFMYSIIYIYIYIFQYTYKGAMINKQSSGVRQYHGSKVTAIAFRMTPLLSTN